MPEILDERERKAKKCHSCSYCGEEIQKGEVYDWAKLTFDGQIYEWKSHKKCSCIASALWSYIDPDNGMTAEEFDEGCTQFSSVFVCPGCPSFDRETGDCAEEKTYCTEKIYSLLQTHDFRRDQKDLRAWRCVPKEKEG